MSDREKILDAIVDYREFLKRMGQITDDDAGRAAANTLNTVINIIESIGSNEEIVARKMKEQHGAGR